jgi:hypothetical protein
MLSGHGMEITWLPSGTDWQCLLRYAEQKLADMFTPFLDALLLQFLYLLKLITLAFLAQLQQNIAKYPGRVEHVSTE